MQETIKILEALASGCSPTTGEVINNDSIFNERAVIRALQVAIDYLKIGEQPLPAKIQIAEAEIKASILLFKEAQENPTANKFVGFFRGSRKFESPLILANEYYGKYKKTYSNGQLLDFFTEYFYKNISSPNASNLKPKPWDDIDFFQQQTFNKLSDNAINILKAKINDLGIQKTGALPLAFLKAREKHPRAFEAWTENEEELLNTALIYTNDLDLLSSCFQRSKGSIEASGKKLIYQSKNLAENKQENQAEG